MAAIGRGLSRASSPAVQTNQPPDGGNTRATKYDKEESIMRKWTFKLNGSSDKVMGKLTIPKGTEFSSYHTYQEDARQDAARQLASRYGMSLKEALLMFMHGQFKSDSKG